MLYAGFDGGVAAFSVNGYIFRDLLSAFEAETDERCLVVKNSSSLLRGRVITISHLLEESLFSIELHIEEDIFCSAPCCMIKSLDSHTA